MPERAGGVAGEAANGPLLDRLGARHPALAAPCRVRPDVHQLARETTEWTIAAGLVFDETSESQLRRLCPEQLAARAFVDFKRDDALLAAQWLAWAMFLDDALDEGVLARSPEAVDALYVDVVGALLGSTDTTADTGPIPAVAAELWARTVPRATPAWRRRFLADLLWHYSACRQAADDRGSGRMPGVAEYGRSRRADSGMFLVDLVEPLVRVELPDELWDSAIWQTLRAATADIVAWCNDIMSLPKELAQGDCHNYVRVIAHAFGTDLLDATEWLVERIDERIDELFVAARALDSEFDRLGLDQRTARGASKIACIYLGAPRGNLEWIASAARYATGAAAWETQEEATVGAVPSPH